jgi:predicted amidohydrolase
MGKISYNRELLTKLITQAAEQKAQIVVLPECAVHGYMNLPQDQKWSVKADAEKGELAVEEVAEPVPGSSTRYFAALAKKLNIYLALPLIEVHAGKYYNALVLLDGAGEIAAHHRKHALWPPGDAAWAAEGDGAAQVVTTPFGRVGLMICFDVHRMPARLKAARADIVLYAVGWYGPNTENWFKERFPEKYVAPNQFAVVAANWSSDAGESWEGRGYSCVIGRDGSVLAMAKTVEGSEIIFADLPVSAARETAPVPASE